ncbi:hypothetical protein PROFUN_03091 [Planoprotostelium fungivorum]|uniref:J domain-containing protein n=1 Tax=Planoprotostelium fungivorum TaxID=1890364 RepID=A0A2P6NQ73_9EUKA|nr:hypothetical protein PROFUN_03091 [Planoprotostelium fungivorum]
MGKSKKKIQPAVVSPYKEATIPEEKPANVISSPTIAQPTHSAASKRRSVVSSMLLSFMVVALLSSAFFYYVDLPDEDFDQLPSDLYADLGLTRHSTPEDIRRTKSPSHPDKSRVGREESHSQSSRINLAYKLLSDKTKRWFYDFYYPNAGRAQPVVSTQDVNPEVPPSTSTPEETPINADRPSSSHIYEDLAEPIRELISPTDIIEKESITSSNDASQETPASREELEPTQTQDEPPIVTSSVEIIREPTPTSSAIEVPHKETITTTTSEIERDEDNSALVKPRRFVIRLLTTIKRFFLNLFGLL